MSKTKTLKTMELERKCGGEAERERGMMTQMMTAMMPHMCEYINPGAQNLRSSGGQGGKREYDFGRRRYLNCVGPLT